jgi:hypothetical protein
MDRIKVEHNPDKEDLSRQGVFNWPVWTKEAGRSRDVSKGDVLHLEDQERRKKTLYIRLRGGESGQYKNSKKGYDKNREKNSETKEGNETAKKNIEK